jgi:hypothetical protein
MERSRTDFSKKQKLIVQACGTGSVDTVLQICNKAKISV